MMSFVHSHIFNFHTMQINNQADGVHLHPTHSVGDAGPSSKLKKRHIEDGVGVVETVQTSKSTSSERNKKAR